GGGGGQPNGFDVPRSCEARPEVRLWVICYFTVPPHSHHKQQQRRSNRVRVCAGLVRGKIAFGKNTVCVLRES
ncbi:unnamed protein product, partial [Ectocarpus fasciculatus]